MLVVAAAVVINSEFPPAPPLPPTLISLCLVLCFVQPFCRLLWFLLAKGEAGESARFRLPDYYAKPRAAICHGGAAEGRVPGSDRRRRERDQTGHLGISLRTCGDTQEQRHEHGDGLQPGIRWVGW